MVKLTSILMCLSAVIGASAYNKPASSSTSITAGSASMNLYLLVESTVRQAQRRHDIYEGYLSGRDVRCLRYFIEFADLQEQSGLTRKDTSKNFDGLDIQLLWHWGLCEGVAKKMDDMEDAEGVCRRAGEGDEDVGQTGETAGNGKAKTRVIKVVVAPMAPTDG